jgi:hypothetical protein
MARHTAASGGRGVGGAGGGTWWSRCGCGGRKCIDAKSEEKIRIPSIVERGRRQKQTNKKVSIRENSQNVVTWMEVKTFHLASLILSL